MIWIPFIVLATLWIVTIFLGVIYMSCFGIYTGVRMGDVAGYVMAFILTLFLSGWIPAGLTLLKYGIDQYQRSTGRN